MNSITIRKSANPKKKTSYALFFMSSVDNKTEPQLFGTYTTNNGSYVEVGRIINDWLTHNSVPAEMERKELSSK